MSQIQIETNPSYPVIIEKGLLNILGKSIKPFLKGKLLIITDENVDSFYGRVIAEQMNENNIEWDKYIIVPGEESKSLEVYGRILEYMAAHNFHRNDTVLAFGGGVVGDLSGFTAASFLRGIDYIQVPTTLLAAVDSSVGGKTAVNLKEGKNLVGAFKQPQAVLCDPDLFATMKEERFLDGVAESIKYGILRDEELFAEFETPLTQRDARLSNIIERCVKHKAEVVKKDEMEKGERQFLNLGHTIGHAIEKASGYEVSHGHAVAMGMGMMARACEKIGVLKKDNRERILKVLEKNGLPTKTSYSTEDLFGKVYKDKKCSSDKITIIEIERIGKCRLHKILIEDFREYIEKGRV